MHTRFKIITVRTVTASFIRSNLQQVIEKVNCKVKVCSFLNSEGLHYQVIDYPACQRRQKQSAHKFVSGSVFYFLLLENLRHF